MPLALALARLRAEGVRATTCESWLCELRGGRRHAREFKPLIGIVKDTSTDIKRALASLAPVVPKSSKI